MVWWLKFSLYVIFIALVFLPFLIYVRTGSIYNKMFTIIPCLLCFLCDWFFPSKKNLTRLRADLCCGICMKLCFEPSTTPCGHSFCRKCVQSVCGKKCPKCMELISNGQSFTLDTVLWNKIQILFPQEIEERKVAAAKDVPETSFTTNLVLMSRMICQDEETDSALRLKIEESMQAFRRRRQVQLSNTSLAREDLRNIEQAATILHSMNYSSEDHTEY